MLCRSYRGNGLKLRLFHKVPCSMFRFRNPELFPLPAGPHVLAPHATMFVFSPMDFPICIHSAVYVRGLSNRDTKKAELNNTTSYITISGNGSVGTL